MDMVAGNWGWNGPWGRLDVVGEGPVEAGSPEGSGASEGGGSPEGVRLYWGSFDLDGRMDVLPSHYEAGVGGYVPDYGLDRVSRALPGVRRRVRSFTMYGGMRVDQVLGKAASSLRYRWATVLTSVVLLNRGERFEVRWLPLSVQASPLVSVWVGDVDGDGAVDVLGGQNEYGMPEGEGRYDGGRGVWVRVVGGGAFAPVSGAESGLRVYGEGRSVSVGDVDGDGRMDVLMGQNGAETRLFLARGTLER